MSQLALYLFGPPRVELEGVPVHIPRRKALALLAYLGATGQIHSRDSLATLLWPENDQSSARGALRRMISVLNRTVGKDWLEADRETAGLKSPDEVPSEMSIWLDVADFQEKLGNLEAQKHPESVVSQERISELEAGIELYKDDFMAGFSLKDCPAYDDWQMLQSEALRRKLANALKQLSLHYGDAQLYETAIDRSQRWLALDPLEEAAHQQLMLLYNRSGQRTKALRQYQICRQTLKEELGVEPAEETQDLYQQIQSSTLDTARDSRFKNNLPVQATPFIGRGTELAALDELIADPGIRLVTIIAPGGMGKTRLALEVARSQVDRYSDGVFFVPLAPLNSPDSIVTTIADVVGFSFYSSDPPTQQLLDYFRERKVLLVMDNFEHLLDGAILVTDILQAAPQVKVLATSREKLNLRGETVFLLSGLKLLDQDSLGEVLEYDAVQLFIQSARRTRPEFEVQPNDRDDLAHICRLTEGNPLGIELAAGWVEVLSLKQIAAELQQGIDILETDLRDIPERHRSIRTTFERTWGRLTGGERAVFSRLSVFRGGFTLAAAQVVAGANTDLFRRLAQKALIQSEANERFGIHELLRQFGEEKLWQADEAEAVQQKQSTYYMRFMTDRDEDIKGRRLQAAHQEIRTDFENIRQAWLWAVAHRQYESISPALDCLANFAEETFTSPDAHSLLSQTIDGLRPVAGESPHPVWDQAVIRREWINVLLGKEIDAGLLAEVLARMRLLNARHDIAYCLYLLAFYAGRIGDYKAKTAYAEECLTLRQSQEDAFYIAQALYQVAMDYRHQNKIELSLEYFRECVRINREIGVTTRFISALGTLGWVLSMDGEFADAEALVDETLAIQAEMGKVPHYGFCVFIKACLAFWRGDFDAVVQLIRDGQDFADGRDFLGMLQAAFQCGLSWVASIGGDYQCGYDLIYDLIEPTLTSLLPNTTMYILWSLAFAQCGLRHYDEAWQALRGSLYAARSFTRGPTHQQICFPLAAVLVAQAGDASYAAKLIGLTQAAPKELMGWLAKWQLFQAVCEQLETELGANTYASLRTYGANLDLDMVVDELLAGFADVDGKRISKSVSSF